MPAKRFDPDFYKKDPLIKKLDFALGFCSAALFWVLSFYFAWYIAPLTVICAAVAGIFSKIKRRYIIYGALSLVFLPLVLWSTLKICWIGRDTIG